MTESAWSHPEMTDEELDEILDEVINNSLEKITELGNDNVPSSVHIALWDEAEQVRAWASIEIVEYPEDDEDRDALFVTMGRMVINDDQIPVAAWWVKQGYMEVSQDERHTTHQGALIIGMTDDNRMNGAFIIVGDEGKPTGAQVYYAKNTENSNAIDSDALFYLFKSARLAYRQAKTGESQEINVDHMASQLFKNVRGMKERDNRKKGKGK